MESTTTWRRLEPRTRDERLAGSLRASVHDPAWSLARQWQLGEFDGVDAGSPIRVDLSVRRRPVTAYGFGDERGRDSGAYTPESPPLEVLAERERVSRRFDDPDRNLRDAADAGAQFLRLLATHDESFDYAAADFADAPALDAYDEVDSLLLDVPDEDLDAEGERFAAVVSGRALDGDRLYHVLTKAEMGLSGPLPLPNESLETDDGYDQSYLDAVSEFREWYGEVYSEPDGEADAWDPERLEYEFEVAAGSDSDRRSLSVEAYEGGGLDWYDFAARKGSPPEPPEDAAVPETETVTTATRPTPVRFGGMPARRWWAFEDGEVNVPNVDAAAEDISRLLLAEYALVSGADWFRVPVELPVGTLATVEDLTVTDTFGRETEVRPTAGIGDSWRLFDFTFQAGNDVERSLFLPPTVTESLETDPVETVTFARDEGANVAWALEEAVEGPLGTRLDRHEQSQQAAGKAADAPVQPTTDADWAYRLSTGVPDYWHPLVPVRRGRRATDLERGEMLVADRDHDTDPKGAILDERDASIPEEEVPRTGKRVTRRYRHARWTDGSTHLWSSREATVGTGEVSSDLQFDVIAERPPGETGALSVAVVSQRSAGGTFENLDEEYVAFRNAAGRTLDLTGWTVADRAGHEYAFPEGFTIDAGDVVRLRTGEGDDDESDLYWNSGAPVWNDAVDEIHVYDEEGAPVTTQSYPDLGSVPDDSPFECLVEPDAPGDDFENLTGEFVAFRNVGDDPVDLTGWRVEDLSGRRYEFPDEFVVDASDWCVVVTGDGTDSDPVLYWGADKPVWNNDGDAALLYDDRDVLIAGTLV
ncbi:lamin tail domain-containing protein [Halorussus caseinilyticus]|uniref:lamin tail domain-containing protein n=1 Tax=Halorussus caseinilyticus TaxID=3034025 RepID=UPI0023E8E227|nr:lamin tail domain-containing protein [Halorussus sp. DT72]